VGWRDVHASTSDIPIGVGRGNEIVKLHGAERSLLMFQGEFMNFMPRHGSWYCRQTRTQISLRFFLSAYFKSSKT